jgi:hypothetical protein
MWDLVDHLVRVHGCSRIAFVGGPRKNPEGEVRAQLYAEFLKRHGMVVDPDLIEHATFTLLGGEQAASKILSRGAPPDAIIAASDAIALGAIKAVQAKGLKVTSDVIVTGFDDLAFARFSSPPLTTIRQPLARMAALAVRSVHAQMQGLRSSRSTELPVELTVRDSCGCGERSLEAPPTSNRVVMHPADYLEAHASRIQAEVASKIALPPNDEVDWAESLMQGLKLELAGDRGAFASCLGELLATVDAELQLYDELQKLVTQLRESLAAVASPALEEVWHSARRSIARANSQGHARLRQELDLAYQHLLHTGERFASAAAQGQLKQVMAEELPHANVRDALVLLYDDETRKSLVPLFCLRDGQSVELPVTSYPAQQLLPASAPRSEQRTTAFVLPLSFGSEALGVAVFGARTGIHEMLRVQISVGLKTASLQQRLEAKSHAAPTQIDSNTSKRLNQLSLLLGTVAQDLQRAAEELSATPDTPDKDEPPSL